VAQQPHIVLLAGWAPTLRAEDRATTDALPRQLARIPPDATHLVISIGGNDALQNSDLLSLPVRSSAEALAAFAVRVDAFECAYRRVVGAAADGGTPARVRARC
jgi:hypothetical protein